MSLEKQLVDMHKAIQKDARLGDKRAEQFYGIPKSVTHNPPNLVDGAEDIKTVTVTGAILGDFVSVVSFSLDLQGIKLTAYVSSANTVACVFSNHTGGAIDLAEGTLKVRVVK